MFAQGVGASCSALGCIEDHTQHLCSVCRDPDSNHRSSSCPARFHATLYHGTKSLYVPLIQQDGALPGSNDRLGVGVYFTTSFEKATAIANYHDPRGQNLPGCVITFRVNLGQRLKNLWDDETGARMQPLCCGRVAVTFVLQTGRHGLRRGTTRAMPSIPNG